jgi:hypothetical protein
MAQTAWRCSQCGTVNEPGARACRECGKWPSLFDLQDGKVDDDEPDQPARIEHPGFDRIPGFEPDPETFDPAPFDPGEPDPGSSAPEVGETEERTSRFPRWAVTAVWVIGVLVWIVVRALGDQG